MTNLPLYYDPYAHMRPSHTQEPYPYSSYYQRSTHLEPTPVSSRGWTSPTRKVSPVVPTRKPHPQTELSRTNIYISGLAAETTDDDLKNLCRRFGEIISTKAIIDKDSNICKGYGFVMFEEEYSARAAIEALVRQGAQATFAKVTRAQLEHARCDLDPTNLYFTNLPKDVDEAQLTALLLNCLDVSGDVVSCRVLRDELGGSRGVGLARLDSNHSCEAIISRLNGFVMPGCLEPLRVKYANGPAQRRTKPTQRASHFPESGYFGDLEDAHFFEESLVPETPATPRRMYAASAPVTPGRVPPVGWSLQREAEQGFVPTTMRSRVAPASASSLDFDFDGDEDVARFLSDIF